MTGQPNVKKLHIEGLRLTFNFVKPVEKICTLVQDIVCHMIRQLKLKSKNFIGIVETDWPTEIKILIINAFKISF